MPIASVVMGKFRKKRKKKVETVTTYKKQGVPENPYE